LPLDESLTDRVHERSHRRRVRTADLVRHDVRETELHHTERHDSIEFPVAILMQSHVLERARQRPGPGVDAPAEALDAEDVPRLVVPNEAAELASEIADQPERLVIAVVGRSN